MRFIESAQFFEISIYQGLLFVSAPAFYLAFSGLCLVSASNLICVKERFVFFSITNFI